MHIPVIKKECSLEKLFYGKVVIEVKIQRIPFSSEMSGCTDMRIRHLILILK
jgi:hypothetical protein